MSRKKTKQTLKYLIYTIDIDEKELAGTKSSQLFLWDKHALIQIDQLCQNAVKAV
jgi:hypothetical protein